MTLPLRLVKKPQFVSSQGGAGNEISRTYHYGVFGTNVESTARSLANADLGPVISTPFGVLYRGDTRCDQTAYDQWDVDVEFLRRPAQIGTWTFDFDNTGGTQRIFNSKETIASYPAGTAPNFNGAIDVDQRDGPRGADVVVPNSRRNYTFTHPVGVITETYANYLDNLVGYVNSATWHNRSAGEVLFLGARGTDGSQTEAQVTYSFAISRNWTNQSIGSITGINKGGWQFMWIKYKEDTSTVSGTIYPVWIPQFVYVERVYDTIDFTTAFGF